MLLYFVHLRQTCIILFRIIILGNYTAALRWPCIISSMTNISTPSLAKKTFPFLLGGVLALISLIYFAYHLAYLGKIYPGIKVAGYSIGNLTPSQATEILERAISQQITTEEKVAPVLILTSDEQNWEINLVESGLEYQATQTTQKAFQLGRTNHPFDNLITKINAWTKGISLEFDYQLEPPRLIAQMEMIANQVFVPPIEPTIKIVNQKITIEPGKNGQKLEQEALLSKIATQLAQLNFETIRLPISHLVSSVTLEQIENTRQRAEKFIGKKFVLTNETAQWELQEEDLIQLLSFTNGFNQEKIAEWAANLASSINRPPENAAFQFSQGKVTEFRPAKEGQTLNETETINLIVQLLKKLELGENEAKGKLPIETTPPAIKTADVNRLGIQELIGRGVSYFQGSIASRIHNIQLASSKLNGILVAPGEAFSFNSSLGEVSLATGYKEAYIIKEGRTVLGDGGGVCQVSTTLFRAILDAGLPILERHAHAYRVSYYEQNSPVGQDATVFDPTADLKFQNDTPAYILIQTKVDTRNKVLVFEFYGTHDGRAVTISKSRIWDQTPPPPDLYQDDPTLPAGTVKQIDWKAWGAKVSFDYRVKRNEEVLQNRTFYSHYHPWQAIFLRGTAPP